MPAAPVDPHDIDNDGDGYTENQGDCNDNSATVYPVAVDICGDGIDQDCSGADLTCPENIDNDGDGYTENQGDCNDNGSSILQVPRRSVVTASTKTAVAATQSV